MASYHPPELRQESIQVYEHLLADNLSLVLDRHDRRPDYPFIDTKLSLISGKDFEERSGGRDIYSRNIVYGWIQGRGIEALAEHLTWLPQARSLDTARKNALIAKSEHLLAMVLDAMESLCQINDGRVTFMLSSDGTPLQIESDGRVTPLGRIDGDANFSDLFYTKGLYTTGRVLNLPETCAAAEANLWLITNAIFSGNFVSDQQPINPYQQVAEVPGRIGHGPYMIALGGVAAVLGSAARPEWADVGAALIQHILDRHVNHGQFTDLPKWDFVEFVDPDGDPWRAGEVILCDPGHSIEFVGLTCKVLLEAHQTGTVSGALRNLEHQCCETLPALFRHVFDLGFSASEIGIYKAVDLVTRQPSNTDMPWWSLPETLRAGALLVKLWPDRMTKDILTILRKAHRAFFGYYVNPAVYSMAFQTVNMEGKPVDVIPGVPDADPCYHTGLSILDVLRVLYEDAP